MGSSLRLIMEKGPRAGETLDFNPRSVIRIGRVIRGNTVSIKDLGISSKHLLIEKTTSGKWTITDLDSSNGTLLNSSALPPGKPFDLRDGDVVKIGEVTSIRVQFVVEAAAGSQIRRNPRRGDASSNAADSVAKKLVGVELEANREEYEGQKWGYFETDGDLKNVVGIVEKRMKQGRGGRGRAKGCRVLEVEVNRDEPRKENVEDVEINGDLNNVVGVAGKGTRRGRGRGRGSGKNIRVLEERGGKQNVGTEEPKEGQESRPKCFESSKVKAGAVLAQGMKRKDAMDVEPVQRAPPCHRGNMTVTKDFLDNSLLGVGHEEKPNEEPIVSKKPPLGCGGRKKNAMKHNLDGIEENMVVGDERDKGVLIAHEEAAEQNVKEQNLDDIEQHIVVEDERGQDGLSLHLEACNVRPHENVVDELSSLAESCERMGIDASIMDKKEAVSNNWDGAHEEVVNEVGGQEQTCDGGDVPDLEKMTLREWFDYLEVYLPKQVRAATNEVIEDMRKRTHQVHDFMQQLQKQKEELSIG
ncbi:hypothetical protein Dimus_000382 [Dionaea muscipula]